MIILVIGLPHEADGVVSEVNSCSDLSLTAWLVEIHVKLHLEMSSDITPPFLS